MLVRYPRQEESEGKAKKEHTHSLPLALKPTARAHDGNTLIHDNLANGKIPRDPRLCGFIVGDFVFVDTGAGL